MGGTGAGRFYREKTSRVFLIRSLLHIPSTTAGRPAYSKEKAEFPGSELDAQRALDDTRSAAYHARCRADCRGGGAAKRRYDLPEVCAALTGNRVREDSMVEEVKELRAEAQVDSFGAQGEEFGGSKIPVLEPRAAVLVAAGGAESPWMRSRRQVREKR